MKKIYLQIYGFLNKDRDFFILLLIFSIGIFFRLYKISTIPFGLNNDAAWEGSAAINILHGNINNYLPYAAEGWRGEGIIRFFVAIFMFFLKDNPLAIRLASVIFGIGLIIPLFLLIRNLFNTKIASITCFFVAISGWHITMSKTGWRAITVPFFSVLLFYYFFKGLKTKKIKHFILSGIMLSIGSLYTYDAGRIILPFFILWLIIETLSTKNFLRKYANNIIILAISFLIFSIPMILYANHNWENFTSRSNFLFIGYQIKQTGNLSPLLNNFITSASLFNIKANGNDFFIFDPLVDKPIAWFIPIGFFLALWLTFIKRKKNYAFMLCFFMASLTPGILSTPNGNRTIGVIPSVYFLASIGFLFALNFSFKILRIKNKIIIYGIIALFLIISTFITYNDYLGPLRKELPGFYPETLITIKYIKTIQNKYDIYLTDNFPREILTYLLYKKGDPFQKNYTWLPNNSDFLNVSSTNKKGLAFFMFSNYSNNIIANELMHKFNNAQEFYLWYDDTNIHRIASLVVLAPLK